MTISTDTDEQEEQDEDTDDTGGVSYSATPSGPGREDMAASYLPEPEDWSAKTVLERTDPGSISALRQFHRLFPEVEDLQPVIDEFLFEFMKSRTSVAGQSRQEYQDILMSMFGGHPDSKKGSALAEALASDLYEDD